MSSMSIDPTDITVIRADKKIKITWSDGKECTYQWDYLRRRCPCAACSKRPDRALPESIILQKNQDILKDISAVGRYAIRIVWQDNHNTGIFSFEYLRGLCDK